MTFAQIDMIRTQIKLGINPELTVEELGEVVDTVAQLQMEVASLLSQRADRDVDIEQLKKDVAHLEEYVGRLVEERDKLKERKEELEGMVKEAVLAMKDLKHPERSKAVWKRMEGV